MSSAALSAPGKIGALEFRRYIETHGLAAAGKLLNPGCASDEEAKPLIRLYIEGLLARNKRVSAGVVLWGERLFNPRPLAVRRVWRAIEEQQKVIIPGGSALGKTYTAVCWVALRWIQDPENTTVKLISVTGKHTESNIFGTIKMLFESAVVPLGYHIGSDVIATAEGEKRKCIGIVRIRQGEDNSEVLQGFHPLPRAKTHPIYGDTTAVFVVLDECEGIPNGVWTGVANVVGTGDKDHVKVVACYNPKDITAKPAQLAEPVGGWGEFDVETGVAGKDEWISAAGWYVVRLDPKKTENVQQRKLVHDGFHRYESFKGYEQQGGGNSQHYFVFGRGCYPPDSAENTVTPLRVLGLMRGEFIFSGRTTNFGAGDTAIDGRDDAIFSVGRAGMARAFHRQARGPDGVLTKLLVTFKKERYVAQLDQQFAVAKGSTEIVAAAFKEHCLRLKIAPQHFMLDATGNGEPVYLLLRAPSFWSPLVRGIRFGDDATETKILEEDQQTARDQYDGIVSEVLFAITRWGEFGYLAIAPTAASEELERQLVGRKYKLGPGQTLRVEDKKDYKKRLGRSPDHADSFSIWLQAIRTAERGQKASMTDHKAKEARGLQFDTDSVDKVEWLRADGV